MVKSGLRRFAKFPPIGVSRAIYRAFSDDKDLAKTFFDLFKNTAVTAVGFALLAVSIGKSQGQQSWVAGTILGMGCWIALLALVAQSIHHFGRVFRLRIAQILYPELALNPVISVPLDADSRWRNWQYVRFAKRFYVPLTLRSIFEIVLVSSFAYGFVALLLISFFVHGADLAKKLSLS
jgi:hypothetical protein